MKMVLTAKSRLQRTVLSLAAAAVLLAGTAVLYAAPHARHEASAQEKEAPRDSSGGPSTTLIDQTDLSVTVYNSNIALVRDVRNLSLPSGLFRLKLMDIAATVNPATVHFRSLNEPDKLGVLEQNYEYDLLEPAKLLHKYVGKEVTLIRSYMDNGSTKREEIKATLLADNNGPVWKIGNDIVTGGYAESYRFPEVPANLFDRPTLLMSLENSGSHRQQIETSYGIRITYSPWAATTKPPISMAGSPSSTTAAPHFTTRGCNSSPATSIGFVPLLVRWK